MIFDTYKTVLKHLHVRQLQEIPTIQWYLTMKSNFTKAQQLPAYMSADHNSMPYF